MKKLTIEDKNIINNYIKSYQIEASELSFTNLFAWREKYGFHYVEENNFLWIINKMGEKIYFSQPIGNYKNPDIYISIQSMIKQYKHITIKKSDERFKDYISNSEMSYILKSVRDDYDYLYDFDSLKFLKGNKNHKKKNHINKFKKDYEWSYKIYEKSLKDDMIKICEDWFEDQNDEYKAIVDVLDHFEMLDCSGGILYIQDKPVAFIIGEMLNNETLVIHFEKAVAGYHGLYQMVLHQYLLQYENVKYVNREQDLGIPGLRKSKLSYHPIDFVKKYNVQLGE